MHAIFNASSKTVLNSSGILASNGLVFIKPAKGKPHILEFWWNQSLEFLFAYPSWARRMSKSTILHFWVKAKCINYNFIKRQPSKQVSFHMTNDSSVTVNVLSRLKDYDTFLLNLTCVEEHKRDIIALECSPFIYSFIYLFTQVLYVSHWISRGDVELKVLHLHISTESRVFFSVVSLLGFPVSSYQCWFMFCGRSILPFWMRSTRWAMKASFTGLKHQNQAWTSKHHTEDSFCYLNTYPNQLQLLCNICRRGRELWRTICAK